MISRKSKRFRPTLDRFDDAKLSWYWWLFIPQLDIGVNTGMTDLLKLYGLQF